MQNNFQGLANAILSHSDDSLIWGAEAATLVVWNFLWHRRKRSCACLLANFPQTKRNQDFLLEVQEVNDVQDVTTQPQIGLSTGQQTGSANKSSVVGPSPCGWTLFCCCQIQAKRRDRSLSSSSKYKNGFTIHLTLWTHVLFHRNLYPVTLYLVLLNIPCSLQDQTRSPHMGAHWPHTHFPATHATRIPPEGPGLTRLPGFLHTLFLPPGRE